MIALGVKLKCLANDRRTLFIYDDRFITRVIDISNWSQRRIFAPSHFLAQSSFSIFGKRIYIVFALPKSDVQHKFSLWCRFKPELHKFQCHKSTCVHKINYFSTVNRIAR
ncbi:MAG: hypothetical protein A3C81_02520 [Candidatus Yanofskybacteria bacterium RIFCSPHIGHO2_02_FULL_46_19]|uniref:Uncharacterized protein n=1 Tax=Candidatus Yanofskybacteria bacterium RIFCSPHIGHO2_02_FULL_46_19 TaxID=1802684 RepID=A0A1F8FW08_9BACT|nr:MAG: hypothetical protein A3C81_02520 [Candidatus Yanofskybacteria bacterium RIFCSPHIGHO2_02_FULL_46_19]